METNKLVAMTMKLEAMKAMRRALRRIMENNRARWSEFTRAHNASLFNRLDAAVKGFHAGRQVGVLHSITGGDWNEINQAATCTLVVSVTEAKSIRRALRRVAQNPRWAEYTRSYNSTVANKVHAALAA